MPLWDGRETPEEYAERKQRNEEKRLEWEERQRKRQLWEEGEVTRQYNRGRMEFLVREARGLYDSADFHSRQAGVTMKDLNESARQHKYVGRDFQHLNDEYWAIMKALHDKRQDFYTALNRRNEEHRLAMSLIVDRIESLADSCTVEQKAPDFNAVHDKLEELTREFNTYRCRKEDKDYLWAKLRAAKDRFHKEWNEFRAKKRAQWDGYRETARDSFGNKIGEYKAGDKGYVHTTSTPDGDGHTTGHAAGDLHHHGTHASAGNKHNFTRSNAPPSGNVINNIVKK